MPNPPQINVFISSPSDVTAERASVARIVARLDDIWKGHVRLNAVLWESGHYQAAQGFQETIGDMAAFDIVLGILWKRVGSPLRQDKFQRRDGSAYESGTVFELETAIQRSEQGGSPTVYMFRKSTPVSFSAEHVEEERVQYETLTKWWDRTFRNEAGNFVRGYQEFDGLDELENSVEVLLENYLRERELIPAGAAWTIEERGSPYPGLLAYNSEYSDVFFGRSLAASAAMESLTAAVGRDSPALFVVGPSGSGKSSLARAGLAPRIDGGQIAGVDFWRKMLIEPAQDAVLEFSRKLFLERGLPELRDSPTSTPEAFAALCRQSADAATGAVKWGLERAAAAETSTNADPDFRSRGKLLIVLDQLETFLDNEDRSTISGLIRALVESETAWVIATLRSDRYAELQTDEDLIALKRKGAMFDLPPPGSSEIADIIKGPARAAGLEFEAEDGASLADEINADAAGADALPLLQMTLARLFEARNGTLLTFSAYREMGGIEGAIASHAEAVFGNVSPDGQAALDRILRPLVADIDDEGALTLRTVELSVFDDDSAAQELIVMLTEGRLLVNAEGTIRIAHEALLRRWRRATESPALQPAVIRLRRQLEPAFQVWQSTGLDLDLLQPGTTTIAAAETVIREHPGAFSPALLGYIERSLEVSEAQARAEQANAEARAVQARRRSVIATVAAIAFAGLALATIFIYSEAEQNLSFAMLTKAEGYIRDEKPARALVAANAARVDNPISIAITKFSSSTAIREKNIRAATIAAIAAPASASPELSYLFPQPALAVAFDPSGRRFAASDQSGEILVSSVGEDRAIKLRGHRGGVHSLRFSPDGNWLASGGADRTVRIWNLETGDTYEFCEHTQMVTEVEFSPNGRLLASTSNDGRMIVRDVVTKEVVADFTHRRAGGRPGGWALSLDFSADGLTLVSTDEDGNLFIHEVSDWSTRRYSTGRSDLISVSVHPNGLSVATAGINGDLDVWSLHDGSLLQSISEHQNKLWKVRYSPSGKYLAVASWDGTVRLWDAQSFQYAGTVDGSDHWITDIAFSDDSDALLTADWAGVVRLWRISSIHSLFRSVRDNNREVIVGTYSRDGSLFMTGSRNRTAHLYKVTEGGDIRSHCRVMHENWVISVDFSADGRRGVSAGTVEGQQANRIRIWSTDNCRILKQIDVGTDDVLRVVFDPVKDRIAWSTRKGQVRLLDLSQAGPPLDLSSVHSGVVYALEFNSDGTLLASGGVDGRIIIWDVEAGSKRWEINAHSSMVVALRFLPKGGRIVSASLDEDVLIWDLTQPSSPMGKLYIRGRPSGAIYMDASGETLAIGSDGRYVSLWRMSDFSKVFQLETQVGVRGMFGIHPKTGDLAFDGENGIVRILRNGTNLKSHSSPENARLEGTDVIFDAVGNDVRTIEARVIESRSACVS